MLIIRCTIIAPNYFFLQTLLCLLSIRNICISLNCTKFSFFLCSENWHILWILPYFLFIFLLIFWEFLKLEMLDKTEFSLLLEVMSTLIFNNFKICTWFSSLSFFIDYLQVFYIHYQRHISDNLSDIYWILFASFPWRVGIICAWFFQLNRFM